MKYQLALSTTLAFCLGAFAVDPANFKLPAVPIPADNPQTKEKIALGKQLFFDGRLSLTGDVSCARCHNPSLGGTDSRATSIGIKGQLGGRNAPTVFGAAFLSAQFWDGRKKTLEEQAIGPITNAIEMGMSTHADAIAVLNKIPGYVDAFKEAFPMDPAPLSIDNVAKAIAAYERELVPLNSPFDQFAGGDNAAINAAAKRGFELMETIGCLGCHSGPAFAGRTAPATTGNFKKFPIDSSSPFVTKYDLDKDKGKDGKNLWRVAPLRNVALTAPYFHNGRVADLKEAIQVMAETQLSIPLKSNEVDDIYEFLLSLTGEIPKEALVAPILPSTQGTTVVKDSGVL